VLEGLPYIIDLMTVADLAQVIAIEQVAFSAPWSVRAFRYEITQNKQSTMLVVRPAPPRATWLAMSLRRLNLTHPGAVLGYAGLWLLVDDIHISTIAVHRPWQGRGLGELLLLSLLDRGAELDARRATLEVRISNRSAQALYRKYGFEISSRRRRYYSDNNEDAYIMATPLFETPDFQTNLRECRARLYARFRGEGGSPTD
jgi:ribosomal-protein-alanine N-acetyltransferase